eukprot:3035872-Alexandrium_andersonii.AAC.1
MAAPVGPPATPIGPPQGLADIPTSAGPVPSEAAEDTEPPAAAAEGEDVLVADQPAGWTASDAVSRPRSFASDFRHKSGLAPNKGKKQGGRKSSAPAAGSSAGARPRRDSGRAPPPQAAALQAPIRLTGRAL